MSGFGSVETPYIENPLAGYIKEIHYAPRGVKWKSGQTVGEFAALTRDAGISRGMSDSQIGTLSFWYRQNTTFSGGFYVRIAIWFCFTLDISAGGGLFGETTDTATISLSLGIPASLGEGVASTLAMHDEASPVFSAIGKWYHVHITWDTGAGTIALRVNGALKSVSTYTPEFHDGPPFTVPWSALLSGTTLSFFLSPVIDSAHACSIAEFWLRAGSIVPVDRFVTAETGKRTAIGTDGAVLNSAGTSVLPHYYFSRRGAAATFIEHRGTAGEFTLTGPEPISEPDPVRFEVGA